MTFTESSTVEQLILDAVIQKRRADRLTVREAPPGWATSPGDDIPQPVRTTCPLRKSRAAGAT
ncbi:hypothetical protein [Methanoculleus sp. UBA303]|jgi:hypothetical protein|uniref:hypothetical protein n=1 Tax=Methanoculleus sp. UBA303 TaxID=1915497 RepID=UPI0025D59401|nr:hypothetical protein [Methanoculleus sp. UBA303]